MFSGETVTQLFLWDRHTYKKKKTSPRREVCFVSYFTQVMGVMM